jgi:hypothetical protein
VSLYAGFIPRSVLELKFKGKRPAGQPRRRWSRQLLEEEEREELARNCKDQRLFVHRPVKNGKNSIRRNMQVLLNRLIKQHDMQTYG